MEIHGAYFVSDYAEETVKDMIAFEGIRRKGLIQDVGYKLMCMIEDQGEYVVSVEWSEKRIEGEVGGDMTEHRLTVKFEEKEE